MRFGAGNPNPPRDATNSTIERSYGRLCDFFRRFLPLFAPNHVLSAVVGPFIPCYLSLKSEERTHSTDQAQIFTMAALILVLICTNVSKKDQNVLKMRCGRGLSYSSAAILLISITMDIRVPFRL
jgi:hypothetical protein